MRRIDLLTPMAGTEMDIGAPVTALGGLVFRGAGGDGVRVGDGLRVGTFFGATLVGDGLTEGDGLGLLGVRVGLAVNVGDVEGVEDMATGGVVDRGSSPPPPQPWVSNVVPATARAIPKDAAVRRGVETRAAPVGAARLCECLPMIGISRGLPTDQC